MGKAMSIKSSKMNMFLIFQKTLIKKYSVVAAVVNVSE